MTPFQPDYAATIRAGRAYIRLIEAATVRAEWDDDDRSQAKWQRLRREAQERLRKLVEVLPARVTAEIMAASEKALGTVRDVGRTDMAGPALLGRQQEGIAVANTGEMQWS